MKKCMTILLVAALLCGILLIGCAQEPQLGSNPGTTLPKQTTQPTQTQPKPTETQPKPTETQPTEPILLDFTDTLYHYTDRTNDAPGILNIWALNSYDDLSSFSYLSTELAPYDPFFFDAHFLIIVELYDHSSPGISYRTAQVQQMAGGNLHLEVESVVERGLLVPGWNVRYAYYLIIEVSGTCKENATVTANITLVLVDPPAEEHR